MSQVRTDIEAIKKYVEIYDKKLIHQMLNGLDVAKDIDVLRNVRSPRTLKKMVVDRGVRRLNTNIKTAKGGRKWSERILTPQGAMKIIEIIPEEVRESFMAEMLDPNAKEIPFGQWVWEQEFARIAQEINDNFYLSFNPGTIAPFDGTETYAIGDLVYFDEIVYRAKAETLAGESPETHGVKWEDVDNKVICDGPHHIIESELAATNLLVAGSGGAYDQTTAYDAFLDMWSVIPEVHKNKGMVATVGFGAQEDLAINVNKLFGTGQGIAKSDIEEGKEFILKGTGGRLTIKPVTWMKDSRRIIMTHKGNMILGMNQVSDANKVGKIVENLHGYEAIVKYMIGFQFRDLENLYVNDQA
ncbi:hypothetical protein [Mongoliibacter ruber]|uniref:Uncharacterized protein n=1 Tax=Mongoliibacter ruber TaxID=1750599 RepID=A0A2T0WV84_9BACT|nr:hypothetical protein [Mongoliibacter ruber]PRY90590.1 hypothetical protein CLW00_101254 [Mongoliibacter ruber]